MDTGNHPEQKKTTRRGSLLALGGLVASASPRSTPAGTRNANDSIFRNGGSRSQVKTASNGNGGYVGRITMGINR